MAERDWLDYAKLGTGAAGVAAGAVSGYMQDKRERELFNFEKDKWREQTEEEKRRYLRELAHNRAAVQARLAAMKGNGV